MGQSPSSDTYNSQQIGLPFFQGKAEFTDLHPVATKWCSKPKVTAEKDDILISVRAPVGSLNIADHKCCIGRGLSAIQYRPCFKFIYYYLTTKQGYLKSLSSGSTFEAISGNIIKSLTVPLPPLPEQVAIVAKLETLLSELDNAVATLKQAKEQIKTYRQSVLKAAFTGKLTEEWRKQQSDLPKADELLSQIQTERKRYYDKQLADYKAGKIKTKPRKQDILTPLTIKEDLPDLPFGWAYMLQNQIADINPRLPLYISNEDVEVSFIPMNSVEARSGKFTASLQKKYSEVKKGYTPFINGDVIFAKITPCMENGKVAVVDSLVNGIGFGSTEFHVARVLSCFSGKWLLYYLLQDWIRDKAKMKMSGGVGQMRVTSDYFSTIPIPCCSKIEQDVIIEVIENKYSIADQLEQSIDDSLSKTAALKHSLLKQAFEGKLLTEQELEETRQSPDWEPAEKLLERIKSPK